MNIAICRSIHSLLLTSIFIVFFSIVAGQFPPTIVQNYDVLTGSDGPNGYAYNPRGLAMDSSGNIFFTEGNSIRMINISGVITLSGPNTVPAALYNGTIGIALDAKGNLIVTDSLNNQIKRIDVNGRVTVLGTIGNALLSQVIPLVSTFATGFNNPYYIAFDSASNLYVSDGGNNVVKKIFPNGTVNNLASITSPQGIAVDGSGNVYVGNVANVYKITPAGSSSVLAGTGSAAFADGTGTSASFSYPYPGVVDGNGNLYVTDNGNNRIRKITSAGVVTTIAGHGTASSVDGLGTSASFTWPQDVKMDSMGNLFVADYSGCKLRKIYGNGTVTTIAGSGLCSSVDGQGVSASFNQPNGLAIDGKGNIYISDRGSCEIRMMNSSNYISTVTGFSGCGSIVNGNLSLAQFNYLNGIALDPNSGNLFVVDIGNNAVRKITFSTQKNALPFNSPTGVAVDSLGNIFIADQLNHMIKFIDPNGMVNILAGSGTASFANGNATSASFNSPFGITLDVYGNVIVADTGNNMIRNVSRSGSVTTIAGNGTAGWVDGQGANSALNSPMGVSVDASNRVYISDSANNCVRVINATGYVNTLYFGRGSNMVLNAPQGILVAPNGDLFIADTGNKRIRAVSASLLIGKI